MTCRRAILLLALLWLALVIGQAAPLRPPVPPGALPTAHFDAQAATNAWLATVPADQRAKSDAYFEGGYWLQLWSFLYLVGVMILLLESGLSARFRNWSQRIRSAWPQAFLYWILFFCATAVLLFPLTVYQSFFREHQYGLSNQTFTAWLRDTLVAFGVLLALGGAAVATILLIVRRLPRTWHLWAALVTLAFVVFGGLIAPVFILPLFNTYTPLKNAVLKEQILSIARANGIPAHDVYEVDASRQSKRVSANVSGLFGTERITLNDNLLNRCSPPAVLSTMGHEMGHYVLHHIVNGVIFACLEIPLMFLVLRWSLNKTLAWRGGRWAIADPGDPAILPLAVLLFSAISFVLTPVDNSFTRTQEYEADIFGLNAARQPDGEAEVDLLLGEYRKLDPGPLEETIFFDHPSGRTRIYAAMRWKAENLCLSDPSLPCANRPLSLAERPPNSSAPPTSAAPR